MAFTDLLIKNEYRSLSDDIPQSFYIPALKESVLYQRAVGFFSSSSFLAIREGIDALIENNGKIQLVISPKLSETDISDIEHGYEVRKIIERSLMREIMSTSDDEFGLKNLSYLAQLIAKNVLDIKVAVLASGNRYSMYHEKMGILTDSDGNQIAFSGSMNESDNAFYGNYEAIDVFCSWTDDHDKECVYQKSLAFKAIWEDFEPGIQTLEFPEAAKSKLLEYRNLHSESNHAIKTSQVQNFTETEDALEKDAIYLPDDFSPREYQIQAIKSWEQNGFCGIYDMATGTGKTLTALASIEHLFQKNKKRLAVIIVCPYQHLVEQWVEDIVRFGMKPIIGYSNSTQKNWKKALSRAVQSFELRVTDHFCFVTTNASFATKSVQDCISSLSEDTLLVVDEAHNIGSAHYRKNIPENIQFRLALSATIDRHNDAAGTDFLKNYFGKKCIVYSLEDAIQNGMLTPYRYYPVVCSLDAEELDEYLVLTNQIGKSIKKRNGKIHLTEFAKQLLIKRARVVAGAKSKLSALRNCILPYSKDNHILIYCGATSYKENDEANDSIRQIDVVADMLGNQLDMRVGRFTSMESSDERQQIRKTFAEGRQLQALVAIKCLDEGVNIPSIKTAFILASSTNPKEYIQRRGRVLRKFPGKEYAEIYDFITLPFTMESFLSQRSDVVASTKGLIVRELRRMMDFASIADNPSETSELIYKLKHAFNITEQDLQNMEVEEDAI